MSTLSIPIAEDLLRQIEELIKRGLFKNKAEVVRKALEKYLEDFTVQEVLDAAKEPHLSGNLDELAKKIG
jgi:Arc/MetJ-type ribon-helix-helix transcriptional regulator